MIILDGSSLDLDVVEAVAEARDAVALAPMARARMVASRLVVEEALSSNAEVYGLTTGVAERKAVRLDPAASRAFSRRLLKGHLVAQGRPAPAAVVRAAMACLVNGFAKGAAGVRPELAEGIVAALNDGVVPLVHSLGSVGVSDLGPMAELAEGLLEHGYFELAENEGLALVNNNAFSTGWAALGVRAAERFLEEAEAAAALDLEAFGANLNMVHPVVGEMRPYPGLVKSIARQRCLLTGSSLFQPGIPRHLQDPLTFRGIPQINGAARDALSYVRHIVEIELNSAQGNPAVVVAERRVVSIANFEVAALAAALDFARICLAPVVGSAAERSVKLLQGPHSGLPAGLAPEADTGEDALAEYAGACQSIAAEARTLARPVSYELVSTTKADGIEDRTTMAPLAARLLDEMVELSSRVVAIELLVAAQAVDLRRPERLGEGTARVHAALRELLPFLGPGDVLAADIEPLVEAVRAGHFFGVAQARAQ